MKARQYKMDKRAYVAYFNYLLTEEKNGATNINGHTIQQEQDEVKKHIDNLDLMILRCETEQNTPE